MAASAKKQPEFIKLLEDRKVELKNRALARIVSLQIHAGNQRLDIASPMIFHSIYLPTKNGASVTIKLQCGEENFVELKPDFENRVFKGIIVEQEIDTTENQEVIEPKPEEKELTLVEQINAADSRNPIH